LIDETDKKFVEITTSLKPEHSKNKYMKPLQRHRLIFTSRRGLVIETLLVLIGCVTAYAQISPTDPTLKMWLKADAITGSTLYQRNTNVLTVPSWTDSSTNGTVVAIVALPPADTANDGIPDEWKKAHGLPLNDPNVAKTVNAEGYTQLEAYLNPLAAP